MTKRRRVPALAGQQYDPTTDVLTVAPTPERLRHANDNYTDVAGAVRFADSPIDRLHRDGALHPTPAVSEAMRDAADTYHEDYAQGGLAALPATDYSKPLIGGSGPPNGGSTYRERRVNAWMDAKKAMGQLAEVVDPVVLGGQRLEAVGKSVGIVYSEALAYLRFGLRTLAVRYGLLAK